MVRFFCLSFRDDTFPTVLFTEADGMPGAEITGVPGYGATGTTNHLQPDPSVTFWLHHSSSRHTIGAGFP